MSSNFHESHILGFVAGFTLTFSLSLIIIWTKGWHGKYTADSFDGVQKIHLNEIPRVGGVAIFFGLVAGLSVSPGYFQLLLAPFLLACIPAFLGGLLDDLTKKVGIFYRLFGCLLSGLCVWWLTNTAVTSTGIWGLDSLLTYIPLSVLFTAIALAGLSNAINIIDGAHGLSSGTALIGLCSIALISDSIGDMQTFHLTIFMISAILGFFCVNYPLGKIFLGDGGAYLLGIILGWLSVLLVERNPVVNPWVALLICGYPITEVLVSVVRRVAAQKDIARPDADHLHSLLWRKLSLAIPDSPLLPNALVAPILWLYAIVPNLLAVLFFNSAPLSQINLALTCLLYLAVYKRLRECERSGCNQQRLQS
jgi:UDP-N-acetylmuramyl pentapeptide phosphotransferase/UDP-N-acetylglucosamine-1-phosphate transferase